MNPDAKKYINRMTNPFIFWWAMFFKLPSAVFWRLKIKKISPEECWVTIPYFWRSQNPFNSIYFAAMAGAAELSTGALCQLAMAGKGKFSMLVVDFRAEYHKKANQKITFVCNQGSELNHVLDSLEPGENSTLTMVSTGTNPDGEIVARFFVTWSFKKK
ncbi:PaaI family thioesterase [Aquiflexum sp.]|uniref:PaaI family thioesterase n=1 Tax=Aquiflexum sp. TaxID=1872584 RepID=UPI003593C8A9